MKIRILATLCTIASAMLASAQVPSLINYQGRLTDAGGAPVTGNKNFAISIYDAASGGSLLYTETIGAVTLDTNGVYSFQFGSAGTSNTQVTESVATTDGTATTFQKVLDNSPVVAGSVSVTDGTYTWSQSSGSSNEDDFGVAYSTSLRRVTVNYYNGAPAAGRTITATYRYGTSGITGALSSGAEHWMAISVDGTPQTNRQRVLAVPFAQISKTTDRAISSASVDPRKNQKKVQLIFVATGPSTVGSMIDLPYTRSGTNGSLSARKLIDSNVVKVSKISGSGFANTTSQGSGVASISLLARNANGSITSIASASVSGQDGPLEINGSFVLDHSNYEYYLEIGMGWSSPFGAPNTLYAGISGLTMVYDSY